ncbi:hypothetical protein L228DRAFT_281998 [Xylona heveae TC161]|uniref:Glutamine amidotransferase domain-containing protein n=1 Tax=Xylona heveae (strain CBS 132557 / TC161) TaxID=1328760 RepID=A0A165HBJ6_XYLHT|nr:hypothetical protein L228DRAFT_281998 [Xylona heveae TC161]KZF23259.1 hypothetical protein L228DRAFT_281998 [Xylona heveae TC161]
MPSTSSALPDPVKAAVLLNNRISQCSYSDIVKHNFTHAICNAAPGSHVDFYDPVESTVYPDLKEYDLIVLSGGTASLIDLEPELWVPRMLQFVRDVVEHNLGFRLHFEKKESSDERWPIKDVDLKMRKKIKLVGVCWGHQAIAKALGGEIGMRDDGPLLGVYPVKLSPQGKSFFFPDKSISSPETINLHKFHKRIVTKPPTLPVLGKPNTHFLRLSADPANDIFISPCNNILSFQGHPELDETLAKALLTNSPDYRDRFLASAKRVEDGVEDVIKSKVEDKVEDRVQDKDTQQDLSDSKRQEDADAVGQKGRSETGEEDSEENTEDDKEKEKEKELDAVSKRMEQGHDGLDVWRRILAWVRE